MGIVDKDLRSAAHADAFEPALGALEVFERREYLTGRAAGRDGKSGGDERVLDLKLADQRQPHLEIFPLVFEPQRLREAVSGRCNEADTRSVAADTEDRQAARLGRAITAPA